MSESQELAQGDLSLSETWEFLITHRTNGREVGHPGLLSYTRHLNVVRNLIHPAWFDTNYGAVMFAVLLSRELAWKPRSE